MKSYGPKKTSKSSKFGPKRAVNSPRNGSRKNTQQKPPQKAAPAADISNAPEFPMRINKYIARAGLATRREADTLVEKGLVTINGVKAVLGTKVMSEQDEVSIEQRGKAKQYLYYAYHKPAGVVTHSPQVGELDIVKSSGLKGVFPIGRLDKDTHGLIILTNDGRITEKLLSPDSGHEKEYSVMVVNQLRPSFKENMEKGVNIGDYVTKPCRVKVTGDRTFKITLTEGKHHQIRRMCEAMHNDVKYLERVRIMNIRLGKLAPNGHRKIEGEELEEFLSQL